MNRRELVAALAERTETDKRSADAALQAFIDTVTETVAKGEPVAITRLRQVRPQGRARQAPPSWSQPCDGRGDVVRGQARVQVGEGHAAQGVQGRGADEQGEEDRRQEDRREEGRPAKKAAAKKTAPAKKAAGEEDRRQEGRREEDRREEDARAASASTSRLSGAAG